MVLAALAATVVPMLAQKGLGLLSDALGSAADTGVEVIKDKVEEITGIDITNQDQVSQLTPDQIMMLKKVENEHEEFLIKYALKSDQMYLADRQDARSMQKVALQQDDVFSKRFVYWFAAFLTAATIIYAFAVTFVTIPSENVRIADTILGLLLGTNLTTIIGFFFGTSKSSEEKQVQIREMQLQTLATTKPINTPLEKEDKWKALSRKYEFD